MTTHLAVAILLAAVAGCAYRLPMTTAQLAGHDAAPALVAYLSQPDASPEVCASGRAGAHAVADESVAAALVGALLDGRIAPEVFEPCALALLRGDDRGLAGRLLHEVLRAQARLLEDERLEADAALQARLDALLDTFAEREPPGAAPAQPDHDERIQRLRRRLEDVRLGPVARRSLARLVQALELERGAWQGRPVDRSLLGELERRGDEELLRRFTRRLSEPALRADAEERLVRLRVRASPFPEVRQAGSGVEAEVLRRGKNPVSLRDHPPLSATLEPAHLPVRSVRVRQQVMEHRTTVLGLAPGRPAPSVFPEVPLRGALAIRLKGLARPVTLCAPDRALDPTPCVDPADLEIASPFARAGGDGRVLLVEHLGDVELVALAARGMTLDVPVRLGGVTLAHLAWPLSFERPGDLSFEGRFDGHDGPDLEVQVQALGTGRLVYAIRAGRSVHRAVVEAADASGFRVVSRGAKGAEGADGMSGTDGRHGLDGSGASCPSFDARDGGDGEDGADGGRGHDGGAGGRGGDIHVTVSGAPEHRRSVLAVLRSTISTEGGRGGAGGEGGRGGRGGAAGSGGRGATCTDGRGEFRHLPSGSPGRPGRDGQDGRDGSEGPSGWPGVVRFVEGGPDRS